MEQNIKINDKSCKNCGLCSEVCPMNIIKKDNNGNMSFRLDRISFCIKCGQCMAICPTKSIMINGLSYNKDFFDLPESNSFEKVFFDMIVTRRSIRNFKDKPVPKEILKKIVNVISFAPPGFTPIKTEVVVVQDAQIIKKALQYMVEFYDFLVKAMNKPIMRIIIKQKVGKYIFNIMKNHLIPVMKTRLPELKNNTEDTITRYAPAMIIFHADKNEVSYKTDGLIALTYGFLAIHVLGLGATVIDLIPPAINSKKELKELFGIPTNDEVTGAIILGYPKYNYKRGIKRELKDIKWI